VTLQDHLHTTVAPAAGAGVSCMIGFDLHAALGYAGQIVGLLSGIASLSWIVYQMYRASKAAK
jgi:hypothetical protein